MLRTALLALLLAASLSAGTIMSDSLSLTYNGNTVSGSGTSVTTDTFLAGGWYGSADLTTNIAADSSFSFPLTVSLTNVNVQCVSDNGCGILELDFATTFSFASLPPELQGAAPYNVSVTGSGPAAEFGFNIATGDGYNFTSYGNTLGVGNYSFSAPGFMGPGNASSPNTLTISGYLQVDSANYLDTISLPGSFDNQVGANDSTTPEPGTWLFSSGAFAIAFAALAWRRRVR